MSSRDPLASRQPSLQDTLLRPCAAVLRLYSHGSRAGPVIAVSRAPRGAELPMLTARVREKIRQRLRERTRILSTPGSAETRDLVGAVVRLRSFSVSQERYCTS